MLNGQTLEELLLTSVNGNFKPKTKLDKELKIMQYTGLSDKNGKEIYEGDVLEQNFFFDLDNYDKDDSRFAIVKYETIVGDFSGGIGFNMSDKNNNPINIESSKVIGNIYENPELLDNK